MTHHDWNTDRTPSGPPRTAPVRTGRNALGLPLLALVGLALLGVPRVILHDLDLIHEGTFVNLLLVVVPVLVWIAVAVARDVPRPFLTLLLLGACYGVLLALVHQLLWGLALPGGTPSLGGNLAGLDPTLQAILMRTAAAISSLFTGLVVGVLAGLVAEAVRAVAGAAGRGGR